MLDHSSDREIPASAHTSRPARRYIAVVAAVLVAGTAISGYAIHEHNAAAELAAKNDVTTAALVVTRHEIMDLTTKMNVLMARSEAQPAVAAPAPRTAGLSHSTAPHVRKDDPRYKKLQAQIDAQNKAIEETRNALSGTQGDLVNTRTELTGSIAHTHDELVVLQKRGERNYIEFDLNKSKEYEHKGPFGIRLKKANVKHQFADLELIVDDRNLSQKHINLYQPVMYYTPDSPQPVEVVINEISKDHIRGYVSAPKYRQSELASMADSSAAQTAGTAAAPTAPRKRLTVPQ